MTNRGSSQSQSRSSAGGVGRTSLPSGAKLLLLAISLVTGAVGFSAILTGHAPERSTRFGVAGPVTGANATGFGIVCVLLALVPLLVLIRDRRIAAFVGGLLAIALFAVVFLTVL